LTALVFADAAAAAWAWPRRASNGPSFLASSGSSLLEFRPSHRQFALDAHPDGGDDRQAAGVRVEGERSRGRGAQDVVEVGLVRAPNLELFIMMRVKVALAKMLPELSRTSGDDPCWIGAGRALDTRMRGTEQGEGADRGTEDVTLHDTLLLIVDAVGLDSSSQPSHPFTINPWSLARPVLRRRTRPYQGI
jgi:hypothetical protein